jgi:uncharacterized protein
MSNDTPTPEASAPSPVLHHREASPTWAVPKRPTFSVLVVVLIVACGAIGYFIGNSGSSSTTGRLSVTGSATVMGMSDSASFQIGVQTDNANASTSLSYNNQRVAALEKALMRNDVTKADLQTSNLSIYPIRNQYGHITGFTVNDTLTVTMSAIADVGKAIEAAARTAGNGVELNNISFSITKDSQLMASARATAIHNASTEANDLLSGTGSHISGIISITDNENSPSTIYDQPLEDFGDVDDLSAPVPIRGGQQTLSVQVSVVYALSN